MRVGVVNVGLSGRLDIAANGDRLQILASLLQDAVTEEVDLLVLPGAFLTVQTVFDVHQALDGAQTQQNLAAAGIAVVLGVDTIVQDWSSVAIQAGHLPAFALAWNPGQSIVGPWRQRTVTSRDQHLVPNAVANQVRAFTVQGVRVGVLVCGEAFSIRTRNAYRADHSLRVVVDVGHTGHHWRIWGGLKTLTQTPCRFSAIACSHVDSISSVKYCYQPGSVRASSRSCALMVNGPPHATGAIFDL